MAGHKVPLLLALAIVFAGASTALVFDISVDEEVRHDFKDFTYQEEVENLQNINVSVMNTGSIGCQFQLRASFNSSRNPVTRYSQPHSLWPGQTARLSVYYSPDEVGERKANISLETCRGWQEKRAVNFTVENTSNNNKSIEYKKLDATESQIKVSTGVEDAMAVPEESPSFWEVPHAQVKDGKANLSYEPEIYSAEENITYKMVNRSTGEALGSLEVSVGDEKTFWDYLKVEWLSAAFLVSMLLNVVLFYRYRSES